jgi:hypothetical protein
MQILRIIPFFTLMALLHGNAIAGWQVTCKIVSNEGSVITETLFIEQGKIKIELPDIIATFDLKSGSLILADPVNFVYYQGSMTEYTDGLKTFRLAALLESDKGLTEKPAAGSKFGDSAQIENYYNDLKIPAGILGVVKTETESEIAGYRTTKYNILLNGILKEEVWIAPEIQLGEEFVWSIFLNFLKTTGIEDMAPAYLNSPEYFDLLNSGFPLRRIIIANGIRTETQVSRIKEKTISGYEFETPSLSKKLSIAGWLGQQINTGEDYDDYE